MNKKTVWQFTALAFAIAFISWGVCILFGQFGITTEKHYWLYIPYLLGGFAPTIASYIALMRNGEITGFKEWIMNIFTIKKPIRFYLFVIVLNAAYFVPQMIICGTKERNPLFFLIALTPLMLFGGGLEEAGWRYILQPELDKKCGYFLSSVAVSAIWSIWHYPLFLMQGTSQYGTGFLVFSINIIGLTFALGAIRKITGSVFLCVLFHCIHNAGSVAFNIPDTLFGNVVTTALLTAISLAAVLVFEKNRANTDAGNTQIDSMEAAELGGIKQWISLRSANTSNPILLFLHGGPGTAQIAFSRKLQAGLEKDFIVINWDQRGAGRSYSSKLDPKTMRIEQFVSDAEELAESLLRRFKQDKLILVGHSWGSIIGARLAAKRPDLLWAYVGIGQVADMERGEMLSYQFTVSEAKRTGNHKAVQELERIGKPPYAKLKDGGIQRKWLDKFGGQVAGGAILGLIFKSITVRDLGLFGLVRFIQGTAFSLKNLEEQQNRVNLFIDVPEINVPVFFCCGRRDYTVPFELAAEYLDKLRAPQKELVWFEHSAHAPNFEEPDVFREFCVTKLKDCIV